MLDGKRYAKNRLVLAVVQKYMEMHPDISASELIGAFDKSLQGSLGVVRTLSDVEKTVRIINQIFCESGRTDPNDDPAMCGMHTVGNRKYWKYPDNCRTVRH